MSHYLRLTRGLNDKGELIPAGQDISSIIKKNPRKDFYLSLFRYEDEHLQHFQQTGSVKGITGLKTQRLVWDFDSKIDIELARKDTIELLARLVESGVPEEKLKVYFSGNKGFGVEVDINESLNRQEFVNIQFGLAGDLGSFDTTINNDSRIIRVPLTQHPESGLYKIPLSLDELASLSIEEIKEEAETPYGRSLLDVEPIDLPEILQERKKQQYKIVDNTPISNEKLTFDTNDLDLTKCPKWMAPERFALQEGFFMGSASTATGERNTAFLILAATYRNQGFSADHALGLLMATAERQAARTGEEPYTEEQMRREIVSTVFNPGWRGGIFPKDEPLLVATRERFGIVEDTPVDTDLVPINEVGDEFKSFARNIDRNTVKTGLKLLDDNVLITSGMMVSLLAAPGAGKTSFANLFVENLSMNGETTLYFSLDMYSNLLFARLMQKYSGYSMRDILDMFKEDSPDETLMKAYSEVLTNFSNVQFNFRSGPTVEEIEAEIIKYRDASGKAPKLVVIDYLEKVRGPFADATANSAYVASRLADIAKKHHLVLLLLVQPQKSAGDPREELTSYRKIKGASVIEQDSRVILTLSRPGYNPKDMSEDRFASISVVKNNMGSLSQLDFYWDGITGSFGELDPNGKKELKNLRENIAEQKAMEHGSDI